MGYAEHLPTRHAGLLGRHVQQGMVYYRYQLSLAFGFYIIILGKEKWRIFIAIVDKMWL